MLRLCAHAKDAAVIEVELLKVSARARSTFARCVRRIGSASVCLRMMTRVLKGANRVCWLSHN